MKMNKIMYIDKNGDLPEFEQAQDLIFQAYAKTQKGE